jgi:hypothetical protein
VSKKLPAELVDYDSRARAGMMRYCVAKAKITAIKMTRRDVRTPKAISGENEMSPTKQDKTTHIAQWWASVLPQYARYYLRWRIPEGFRRD